VAIYAKGPMSHLFHSTQQKKWMFVVERNFQSWKYKTNQTTLYFHVLLWWHMFHTIMFIFSYTWGKS
jgi:hypothetical protein